MSCPAQLFNCPAFMPPVCTLTLERTSLPQVKTSVTAQAGGCSVTVSCMHSSFALATCKARHFIASVCLTESLGISAGEQALDEGEQAKSDEYSDVMSQQMGSALSYRHEKGINFADILDDLMVGSCLQTPEDVDR